MRDSRFQGRNKKNLKPPIILLCQSVMLEMGVTMLPVSTLLKKIRLLLRGLPIPFSFFAFHNHFADPLRNFNFSYIFTKYWLMQRKEVYSVPG